MYLYVSVILFFPSFPFHILIYFRTVWRCRLWLSLVYRKPAEPCSWVDFSPLCTSLLPSGYLSRERTDHFLYRLSGILLIQTVLYFKFYPRDSKRSKSLVGVVWSAFLLQLCGRIRTDDFCQVHRHNPHCLRLVLHMGLSRHKLRSGGLYRSY